LPLKALQADEVTSLYQKHGASLVAYVCCCGLDFGSAEDVVQQVFLKLLRGSTFLPESPVAYLYRAVRNASLNHRRKFQREVELPDGGNWLIGPSGRSLEALAVQAALRALPEEQRETVFLKVWGGMTLQEIADLLEISIHTVASRHRYALEKLRERLEPAAER